MPLRADRTRDGRPARIRWRVSAANCSETAQKVATSGADWALARGVLLSYDLTVQPVTVADAEAAASLWRRGENLSLEDRLCLALGARLQAEVLTADSAWADRDGVVLVR
ncbi:PIN domain-containing protein [Rathayibacter sp. CAU 1779]